jgi:hypothetical protein
LREFNQTAIKEQLQLVLTPIGGTGSYTAPFTHFLHFHPFHIPLLISHSTAFQTHIYLAKLSTPTSPSAISNVCYLDLPVLPNKRGVTNNKATAIDSCLVIHVQQRYSPCSTTLYDSLASSYHVEGQTQLDWAALGWRLPKAMVSLTVDTSMKSALTAHHTQYRTPPRNHRPSKYTFPYLSC